MRPNLPAAILALSLACAGHAAAEVATPILSLENAAGAIPAKRLNLSRPTAEADPAYAQALAWRAAGVARTSVEMSFAQSGAKAALGFICGLQPSQYSSGAAAMNGYDPHGRFVGAKLSFALR